jgi:hypothetical protein
MPTSLTFFPVTGNYNAVADPSISGVLNTPVVQPVSALVTFTPRLLKGQLMYVEDYLVTEAYSAEQTVNVLGEPVSGTWTLQYLTDITTPLPFDATPAAVQAALRALPSIGGANVNVVADIEPEAYQVQFTGALANQQIPVLVGNADLLVNAQGAGFCEVTVAPTALGSAQIVADTAIALPPLTARIWNGVLSTIDRTDTPGFQLAANIPQLNLGADLIYDVTFDDVTFNGENQMFAPFGFTAPTDATGVCITDPMLQMLPWEKPNQTVWTPPGSTPMNVASLTQARTARNDWRARAMSG